MAKDRRSKSVLKRAYGQKPRALRNEGLGHNTGESLKLPEVLAEGQWSGHLQPQQQWLRFVPLVFLRKAHQTTEKGDLSGTRVRLWDTGGLPARSPPRRTLPNSWGKHQGRLQSLHRLLHYRDTSPKAKSFQRLPTFND